MPTSSSVTTAAGVKRYTADEAVKLATSCLGLPEVPKENVKVSSVRLSNQCLPFLADSLAGRETYCIEFSDICWRLSANSRSPINRNIRHLKVFMAPDTGLVLKATSSWPEDAEPIPDHPPCAEEERQMSAAGLCYVSLPMDSPKVSLIKALEVCRPWDEDVVQIHACYVLESTVQYSARPVWVVHLRGFPAFTGSGLSSQSRVPEHARNHLRNVVDAKTGEWLGADTTPQPVEALENRF